MLYVFDTSSFVVIGNYYPEQFPSFWKAFNSSVRSGQIRSVREVLNELDHQGNRSSYLKNWVRSNKGIFLRPTGDESDFVNQIFRVTHFQQLVDKEHQLRGKPVADPFVIAAARSHGGTVVTEEVLKPNAARIPNICKHFEIPCMNLEELMQAQGWKF